MIYCQQSAVSFVCMGGRWWSYVLLLLLRVLCMCSRWWSHELVLLSAVSRQFFFLQWWQMVELCAAVAAVSCQLLAPVLQKMLEQCAAAADANAAVSCQLFASVADGGAMCCCCCCLLLLLLLLLSPPLLLCSCSCWCGPPPAFAAADEGKTAFRLARNRLGLDMHGQRAAMFQAINIIRNG